MWPTIPATFSFILGLFILKDSPRYLLFKEFDEGVEILDYMYEFNHKEKKKISEIERIELHQYIETHKNSKEFEGGNISALFEGINAKITILIWINWFVLAFVFYGITYSYPSILAALDKKEGNTNQKDFFPILISILGEFPLYVIGYFMIDHPYFGRKKSLIWSFFLGGILCLFGYWTSDKWLNIL